MKHTRAPRPSRCHKHKHPPIGPMPAAARLLIIGEWLILLATCVFGACLIDLEEAGATGVIHQLSDFTDSVSATALIFVVAALALDYMERTCKKK